MADRQPRRIELAMSAVEALIEEYAPNLLDGAKLERFRDHGRAFTGMLKAAPAYWVMPGRTVMDDEGTLVQSVSSVTVKIGVTGGEPELVVAASLGYVLAVDEALRSAKPGDMPHGVLRIFVMEHDYGPLRQRDTTFAKFPEVHLLVRIAEVQ